jgi:hypothetical protein
MAVKLLAAGDNSSGNLLHGKDPPSAVFVECTLPGCDATDLAQISGGEFLGILLVNGRLIRSDRGAIVPLNYLLTSIYLFQDVIYGVDVDHKVHNVSENKLLFETEIALSVCASSTTVAIINSDHACIALANGTVKRIAEQAVAIGCTASTVFVATSTALVEHRSDRSRTRTTPEPIVAIAANDDDTYFLGNSGKLFKYFERKLVPVIGLPPSVAVSVGIQHCAAVTADGRLFVWGFNPSGQLGIGTDRALAEPICVLDGVHQVTCGTHNTWVIARPGRPKASPGAELALVSPPEPDLGPITASERLTF